MRQNGLEAAVKKLAVHIPVWGICGGYQMLGRTISDPHGVENENSLREPLRGMELIDTDTTLMQEKMRTQTRGKFENVTGIFPHFPDWNFPAMRFIWEKTTVSTGGTSDATGTAGRWQNRRGTAHGKRQRSTGVYGSYVHGIF